eukprot:jgi/Ulvmu1/7562/UM037_0106.1
MKEWPRRIPYVSRDSDFLTAAASPMAGPGNGQHGHQARYQYVDYQSALAWHKLPCAKSVQQRYRGRLIREHGSQTDQYLIESLIAEHVVRGTMDCACGGSSPAALHALLAMARSYLVLPSSIITPVEADMDTLDCGDAARDKTQRNIIWPVSQGRDGNAGASVRIHSEAVVQHDAHVLSRLQNRSVGQGAHTQETALLWLSRQQIIGMWLCVQQQAKALMQLTDVCTEEQGHRRQARNAVHWLGSELTKAVDTASALEKDLASCHFRNCRLSSDLDAALVQAQVMEMVNVQLERHLAASKLAQRQHPALKWLQTESEYRKAVEAALHATLAELDTLQQVAFTVHVPNPGCLECGKGGGGRLTSVKAGTPDQGPTQDTHKLVHGAAQADIQKPHQVEFCSSSHSKRNHVRVVGQAPALGLDKRGDILQQNTILARKNALLQKHAVESQRHMAELQLQNDKLVQQVHSVNMPAAPGRHRSLTSSCSRKA